MFTANDYRNLLNILARAKFSGLEEAEVGIALRDKLVAALRVAVSAKKQVEEAGSAKE